MNIIYVFDKSWSIGSIKFIPSIEKYKFIIVFSLDFTIVFWLLFFLFLFCFVPLAFEISSFNTLLFLLKFSLNCSNFNFSKDLLSISKYLNINS